MGGLTPSSRLSRMPFQVGRLNEHTTTLLAVAFVLVGPGPTVQSLSDL